MTKNDKFSAMVINLDGAHARWQHMTKVCQVLNYPIERVPAVYGNELTDEQINKVWQADVNQAHYKKMLTKPEIGCYLSHVACWQKIVDDDLDYALVLEDDAVIDPSINDYIDLLAKSVSAWDYIELSRGNARYQATEAFTLHKNLQCVKRPRLHITATAQLISNAGAKKLLQYAFPLKRPVDIDLQYWYEIGLKSFSVEPLPVASAGLESQIRPENQTYKKTELLTHLYKKSKFDLGAHLQRKFMHLWQTKYGVHQLDLKKVAAFYSTNPKG